jgi:heme-degrading monooxygenase HmoA
LRGVHRHNPGATVQSGDQAVIAVIFEVWPTPDRKHEYLDLAAALRPLLERIDGFISIERFESLSEPGKILSLSFFRGEAAVQTWRNTVEHRAAQAQGRDGVFRDYRLRIAGVVRDYGMHQRDQAPVDSRDRHG